MKKFCVLLLIILIFQNLMIYDKTYADDSLKSILMLNSYHDGYLWSNETKDGLNDALNEKEYDYYLRIEHMDTKNISSDEYWLKLVEHYKYKFDKDEFDLIIAADDNAVKFLLKHGDDLFGDTPVFFSGVNTLETHDFSDADNYYGVVEKHSILETTKVAQKLNPNIKNIYLVTDDSITGKATKNDAENDFKTMNEDVILHTFDDMSFKEILDRVGQLNREDSIVIHSYFVVDTNGDSYPLEYTARRVIEESSVPVFGIFKFGFGEGSVGGMLLEGYTQGYRVGNMVTDYLSNGQVLGDRFIVDSSFNRYYFDYNVIKELGYNIDHLPSDSILINAPVSFYDKHRNVINFSLAVVVLLMIYVYILRRQIKYQTNNIIKTQTQLIETEQMASLGRLVAGVAHEVNTPIGIGVSLSSLIKSETNKITNRLRNKKLSQGVLVDYLDKMEESSELMESTMNRASELIENFKQVSVDQTVNKKRTIELTQYFKDVFSSLHSEMKNKNIKVEIKSEEEINLFCSTGTMYQILLNLVMNSIKHGFEEKNEGNIIISLSKINYDDRRKSVKIVYKDDGKGIANDLLDKIYDPFFTTKGNDGGTGLGLNIVHKLVTEKLGGEIICRSEENLYTEFEIIIPMLKSMPNTYYC
ncbi:MAG: HAMP domain-containing histidine kinase [Firmicutes bacterium]|nr:HAMP domain-containing histidine kinase [Bacillota bacterium]